MVTTIDRFHPVELAVLRTIRDRTNWLRRKENTDDVQTSPQGGENSVEPMVLPVSSQCFVRAWCSRNKKRTAGVISINRLYVSATMPA